MCWTWTHLDTFMTSKLKESILNLFLRFSILMQLSAIIITTFKALSYLFGLSLWVLLFHSTAFAAMFPLTPQSITSLLITSFKVFTHLPRFISLQHIILKYTVKGLFQDFFVHIHAISNYISWFFLFFFPLLELPISFLLCAICIKIISQKTEPSFFTNYFIHWIRNVINSNNRNQHLEKFPRTGAEHQN